MDLVLAGKTKDGRSVSPRSLSNAVITSSDESIAKVINGQIVGFRPGTVTITVKFADMVKTVTVNVIEANLLAALALSQEIIVMPSESVFTIDT